MPRFEAEDDELYNHRRDLANRILDGARDGTIPAYTGRLVFDCVMWGDSNVENRGAIGSLRLISAHLFAEAAAVYERLRAKRERITEERRSQWPGHSRTT